MLDLDRNPYMSGIIKHVYAFVNLAMAGLVMATVCAVRLSRGLGRRGGILGLATGLGARYPRFDADNPSQVAGSYVGVAFMILAVLFTIVLIVLVGWPASMFMWCAANPRLAMPADSAMLGAAGFLGVLVLSLSTWLLGMRSGVRALEAMG